MQGMSRNRSRCLRLTRIWRTLFLAAFVLSCSVDNDGALSEINVTGCQVNLKQICQVYFDLPDEYLAPSHLDSVNIQRAPNPIEIFFPGPPAIVWCTYDKLKRKVISAGLGQTEPVTDAQITKARAMGFCTDDAKQLRQAFIREQKKRLKSGPEKPTGTFIPPLDVD